MQGCEYFISLYHVSLYQVNVFWYNLSRKVAATRLWLYILPSVLDTTVDVGYYYTESL